LEGARLMADRGINCEVLDLRTLSPLDTDAIIESVRKTHRAVIVHEAQRSCGLAAEIAARINEKALLDLEAPVERVTGFDTVMPLPKLENQYLPNARRVAASIDRVMSASPSPTPNPCAASFDCRTSAKVSARRKSCGGWLPRAPVSTKTKTSSRSKPTKRSSHCLPLTAEKSPNYTARKVISPRSARFWCRSRQRTPHTRRR